MAYDTLPPPRRISADQMRRLVEDEKRRRFLAGVRWACNLLLDRHSPEVSRAAGLALVDAVQDEQYGSAALEIVREVSDLHQKGEAMNEWKYRVAWLFAAAVSVLILFAFFAS